MWLAKFTQTVQVGPQMGTQERLLLFDSIDAAAEFIKANELKSIMLQHVQVDKTIRLQKDLTQQ